MSNILTSLLFIVVIRDVIGRTCTAPSDAFPGTAPGEYEAVEANVLRGTNDGGDFPQESPIVSRKFYGIGILQWDCAAMYDSNKEWLGLVDGKRPILSNKIPDELLTNENSLLCFVYGTATLLKNYFGLNGEYPFSYEAFFDLYGLTSFIELQSIEDDVSSCLTVNGGFKRGCISDVAEEYGYCADVMSIIIAYTTIYTLDNDGFNDDGSDTPFGKCTANCKRFRDPLGIFDDRIDNDKIVLKGAGKVSDLYGFSKDNPAPYIGLEENDNLGNFITQVPVVPHIGFTAQPITLTKKQFYDISSKISAPNYNYKRQARIVINAVNKTANDDLRKFFIEIFDDKIGLAGNIKFTHNLLYSPTYEQNVVFETGARISEYEAHLYAWREKIRYNLIRPTTIIQSGKFTKQFITTWGGPFEGSQRIRNTDFEPYIRVMPHSEYPSGTACVCRMLKDFITEFIKTQYPVLDQIFNATFPTFLLRNGAYINPGSEPGGPHQSLFYETEDIDELYDLCRFSRLYGGQHFTTSITASDALCDRTDTSVYQYLLSLKFNNGIDATASAMPNNAMTLQEAEAQANAYHNELLNSNAVLHEPAGAADAKDLYTLKLYQVLLMLCGLLVVMIMVIMCVVYRYSRRIKLLQQLNHLNKHQNTDVTNNYNSVNKTV